MSALSIPIAALPSTAPEQSERLKARALPLIGHEPVEVPTEHVIHGGMYVRTLLMAKGMELTGVLIKPATVVIVVGSAMVLAGEEWLALEGYNVIPASAGRRQVFQSRSAVIITMMFPTQAKTVEEAEAELSDEAELLLSRRQNANLVVITGE